LVAVLAFWSGLADAATVDDFVADLEAGLDVGFAFAWDVAGHSSFIGAGSGLGCGFGDALALCSTFTGGGDGDGGGFGFDFGFGFGAGGGGGGGGGLGLGDGGGGGLGLGDGGGGGAGAGLELPSTISHDKSERTPVPRLAKTSKRLVDISRLPRGLLAPQPGHCR
jgi:hypothetical protein